MPRTDRRRHASRFVDHPPLAWPDDWIARHRHHHHRFDEPRHGLGAEVEASRGCPYHLQLLRQDRLSATPIAGATCSWCLQEIDRLIDQGVGYIYFIDEIFLPQKALLEALARARR